MKRHLSRVAAYLLLPCTLAFLATIPDIPLSLDVQPYVDGQTPLYSDRPYVNDLVGGQFDSTRLVQLPRHQMSALTVECKSSCTVYRFLCEENDNTRFSDWETTGIRIHVPRGAGTLTSVISKDFGPGTYKLSSGGPRTSSPILVRSEGQVSASGVSSRNKIISSNEAGGFIAFFRVNLLKLGAVCLLVIANFFLVRRLFER